MENLRNSISKNYLSISEGFSAILKFIKFIFKTEKKWILGLFLVILFFNALPKLYTLIVVIPYSYDDYYQAHSFIIFYATVLLPISWLLLLFYPPFFLRHLINKLTGEKYLKTGVSSLRIFVLNVLCILCMLAIVFSMKEYIFFIPPLLIAIFFRLMAIIFNLFFAFVFPAYYTRKLNFIGAFSLNKKLGYKNRLKTALFLFLCFLINEILGFTFLSISHLIDFNFSFFIIEPTLEIIFQTSTSIFYISSIVIFFINGEYMLEKEENKENFDIK